MDGKDAYIVKANWNGGMMWYRTWGGFRDDLGRSVAVNGDHVYVTGIIYGVGEEGEVFLIDYYSPNPVWNLPDLLESASIFVGTLLIFYSDC